DMLGPALGGRQLDVVKARAADALDGLLHGIAVIAVGVDRDDALFHGCTPHSLTRTARPVSDDSMLANTARMAGSTLSAPMPSRDGSFRQSTNRSMMPDLVWLSLV